MAKSSVCMLTVYADTAFSHSLKTSSTRTSSSAQTRTTVSATCSSSLALSTKQVSSFNQ